MNYARKRLHEEPQMNLFAPQTMLTGRVPDGDTVQLAGTVTKVLFVSESRAHAEFIADIGGGLAAKVAGPSDPVIDGDDFTAVGKWVPDPKYGRRFECSSVVIRFPETADDIVRHLSDGAVKGVGPQTALKLRAHHGERLPKVMAMPLELAAADIGIEKANAIAAHFALNTRWRPLFSTIRSHGLGPKTAERILERFGDRAPSIVKNEPYKLMDAVKGIGFKRADAIAQSHNLPLDSSDRIRAGLKAAAIAAGDGGDACQSRTRLIDEASSLLKLPERTIRAEETRMLTDGELVLDIVGGREVVYDAAMHACEEWIADDIFARLEEIRLPDGIDQLIEFCANQVHAGDPNFNGLDAGQHAAVRTALANRVVIVTGGPGTGKTATLKTIMACLEALEPGEAGLRYILCAPTGAAAQRITESTNLHASTSYIALGATGNGFTYGRDNQLQIDVFVEDEASMIDVWMARTTLEAIPRSCRIILIGDPEQLEAVGQGNVFKDFIESGAIPVARLTKVFRTDEGSIIPIAAEAIKNGRLPQLISPRRSADNWTVTVEQPKEAVQKLLALSTRILPDLGWDPIMQLQVVTPGHQNETGTAALNAVLQEALNPDIGQPSIFLHKRPFRIGDKVVQTENDAERGVFNGNIGRLVAIDKGPRPRLIVSFRGMEVDYRKSEVDALQQAWAITVHKAQGAETPVVAPIITTQHHILLKRNLYYTALTRARKLCCTIGQRKALWTAVSTPGGTRLTGLAQRLSARAFAAKRNSGGVTAF